MSTSQKIVLLFFAIAAMWVIAASRHKEDLTFRLTVILDTPSGTKTGSSVLRAEMRRSNAIWRKVSAGNYFGSGSYRVVGEAPVVDLGDGSFVFLPVRGWSDSEQILRLVKHFLRGSPSEEGNRSPWWAETFPSARREGFTGTAEFDDLMYPPTLVTFDDVRRPATARELKDAQNDATRALSKSDIRFRIEVLESSEDLTKGFADRFPQIASHDIFRRPSPTSPRGTDKAGTMSGRHFIQQ